MGVSAASTKAVKKREKVEITGQNTLKVDIIEPTYL